MIRSRTRVSATIRPAPRLRCLAAVAWALLAAPACAATIEPAVLERVARDGTVEALLVLPDQSRPMLAPLAAAVDPRIRRHVLVDALRARADAQQADLRAWLRGQGVEHRAWWIANVVWVRTTPATLALLAARDDIAHIRANPRLAQALPQAARPARAGHAPAAIEYGVAQINAPAVWALGHTGQGVVVAVADTGIRWDHAALRPHYRGWNGSSASHAYNWHDAIHDAAGNSCGNDAGAPCDDYGHGTHVTGTVIGDDGGANQIGVAPGAQWIGCRNMAAGYGTPARYIECMQWTLAPTDANGQNPDPDRAPDVSSNSWGCLATEGCSSGEEIRAAVDNVEAGGILFVAAAGNDGPACNTIGDPPATYDSAFVVGASNAADAIAAFSSRGPVVGATHVHPDVVAPGAGVRSALRDATNSYGNKSGTSMAAPHVAGAAALLMSALPALRGHPQQVAQLLRDTAVWQGITDPYNSGCGGLTLADRPNHQAGWGRIDVWAALQAALADDTILQDGFDSP